MGKTDVLEFLLFISFYQVLPRKHLFRTHIVVVKSKQSFFLGKRASRIFLQDSFHSCLFDKSFPFGKPNLFIIFLVQLTSLFQHVS